MKGEFTKLSSQVRRTTSAAYAIETHRSTKDCGSEHLLFALAGVQNRGVGCSTAVLISLRAATSFALQCASESATTATSAGDIANSRHRIVHIDILGALASAYALTFAVRFAQRQCAHQFPENEASTFNLIAAIEAMSVSETSQWLTQLRDHCGILGMPCTPRIAACLNQAQQVLTSEVDRQSQLVKVARQLLDGRSRRVIAAPTAIGDVLQADPMQLVEFFRYREQCIVEELRSAELALMQRADDSSAAGDKHQNLTLDVARAYGTRILAECFCAAILEVHSTQVAHWLAAVFSLFSLAQFERHLAWWVNKGCLTSAAATGISQSRDQLCERIAPYAPMLANAFGFGDTQTQTYAASDSRSDAEDGRSRGRSANMN